MNRFPVFLGKGLLCLALGLFPLPILWMGFWEVFYLGFRLCREGAGLAGEVGVSPDVTGLVMRAVDAMEGPWLWVMPAGVYAAWIGFVLMQWRRAPRNRMEDFG